MKQAFVIPGFKPNLMLVMADENASFEKLAQLLVLQPSVVALLFEVALEICQDMRSTMLRQPQSVRGIIDTMGLNGVLKQLSFVEDASPEEEEKVRENALDTYELACVLSRLAEINLGRIQAQNFFLYGCLFSAGNDALLQSFIDSQRLTFGIGTNVNITPPCVVAFNLVKNFRQHKKNPSIDLSADGICRYKQELFQRAALSDLCAHWLHSQWVIRDFFERIQKGNKLRPLYV